jgi:hypothetical protein
MIVNEGIGQKTAPIIGGFLLLRAIRRGFDEYHPGRAEH